MSELHYSQTHTLVFSHSSIQTPFWRSFSQNCFGHDSGREALAGNPVTRPWGTPGTGRVVASGCQWKLTDYESAAWPPIPAELFRQWRDKRDHVTTMPYWLIESNALNWYDDRYPISNVMHDNNRAILQQRRGHQQTLEGLVWVTSISSIDPSSINSIYTLIGLHLIKTCTWGNQKAL